MPKVGFEPWEDGLDQGGCSDQVHQFPQGETWNDPSLQTQADSPSRWGSRRNGEDAVVGCLQRTGLSKPGAVSFKLKDISSEFLVFPRTCVRTRKA